MNNAKVKAIKYVATVTGEKQTGKWDVFGTDLGVAVYSEKQKRMYFLFGDTFGAGELYPDKPKNWRGTVAGYTENLDFSEGIKWDGFLAGEDGNARQLVVSHYAPNGDHIERSKICQGGIEVNGNLYFLYESINHWGRGGTGEWALNYGGMIRSTDGGETFEKVYDLSWLEPTEDSAIFETAAKIATETLMEMQPSGVEFDAKAHVAPGFGQTFAADGKDGYIYIYGRLGGRNHGIKVGRVKAEDFEKFCEYEYLTEFDGDKPVWKKFREGLDAIIADPEKAEVIPAPTSNMSVHYNEYLGKWVLVYYMQRVGIHLAVSDTPYGPFTKPELVIPREHPELAQFYPDPEQIPYNAVYGAFTHEVMNREGGRIVPIVLSGWYNIPDKPRFYGSRLFEIIFE